MRFNLKRRLFITNLLPKKTELSAIITQALQETALGHTGGDWLRTNIMSKTNICSDFRSAARILALPLYGLMVPVQRRGEEVQLCKDRIPYLLKDFAWLDEPKTCAASDNVAVVPFGHPALVQLVLNLLWGEKQYCRFVDTERRDLKVVVALAGMALRLALREYSSGMFLALELSLKDNHAIHRSITCRIMNLQGTELLDYTMLVDDLIARGKEMIGAP